MARKNIEIENAQQLVVLLKQYESAKTKQEKGALLDQIATTDSAVHEVLLNTPSYDVKVLIQKINKAIELDEYRPKNMSIGQLAISGDLDYMVGEFDTFDVKLSKMMKDKEDRDKIREQFKVGMRNLDVMKKQFSSDWIHRLNEHKDLVEAARNASEKNAIRAYRNLFGALSRDFCKEYNCKIRIGVVDNWAICSIDRPREGTAGVMIPYKAEDGKGQGAKLSDILVNIDTIRKYSSRKKHSSDEFLYMMLGVFVHEMQHALDSQQARQGVLGPQIYTIDDLTTGKTTEDDLDAATEKSSYGIQIEFFKELKKMRF